MHIGDLSSVNEEAMIIDAFLPLHVQGELQCVYYSLYKTRDGFYVVPVPL